MRWTPGGESPNIEDRRGQGGGGFGGMRIGLGGAAVLLVLSLLFHRNFFALLGAGDGTTTPTDSAAATVEQTPAEAHEVQFVSFVLDDVQRTWAQILPKEFGVQYQDAKLVLFRGAVNSGCGVAQSAMGPFYCPADQKVYLDLGFFDELRNRFGAAGDFAEAYVLAHELGHHVQHLLGVDQRVASAGRGQEVGPSGLSVRLELQADCLAGVWGHSTDQRQLLDPGDEQEALRAAAAVGDDRIQQQETGEVHVDSFTHGSSAQRDEWFQRGFQSGEPKECDTFSARQL